MMRLALACVLAGLLSGGAWASHFAVQATLRDGKQIKGILPETPATAYDAISVDGQTVKITFGKNPDYVKNAPVQSITWDEQREVFIIKIHPWTGEFKSIFNELELKPTPGTSDAVAKLKGQDVKSMTVHFIDDSPKPAPKPGRAR